MIFSTDPRATLPWLLRHRVEENPSMVALLDVVSGEKVTRTELLEDVQRWSRRLAAVGVGPDAKVATLLGPTFDAYSAWLGLSGLRAIEVPVNVQLKGRTLTYLLNHSQSQTILTHGRFLQQIAEVADELETVKLVVVLDATEAEPVDSVAGIRVMSAAEFMPLEVDVDYHDAMRHDTACIIYTSGTTGPPKGVVIPWGWMTIANTHSPKNVQGGNRYSYLSPAHMSGKGKLVQALAEERTLVLRDTFSVRAFWDDISRYDCSVTQLFPQMIKHLLAAPPSEDDRKGPLRHVWTAPLIPEVRDFMDRFDVKIGTGFGMTEIGGPIAGVDIDGTNLETCGKVNPDPRGYEVRLVDEHDVEVPVGQVGELIVRTATPWTLNAGYHDNPQATADAWRNGWFHTGDALRQDEGGNYYFVDRMKDAIRRKGENISSFDVEAYVREAPGVADAAAIGVPSPDGEQEVKVFVIGKDGASLDLAELGAHLADVMPRFMIPRYLEAVDDFPRTPATGRVQKSVLRSRPSNGQLWDRRKDAARSS